MWYNGDDGDEPKELHDLEKERSWVNKCAKPLQNNIFGGALEQNVYGGLKLF
jgi:hypothetical protein